VSKKERERDLIDREEREIDLIDKEREWERLNR